MSRVKRGVQARKKRRATLERAKGYRGARSKSYKRAKEALLKADSYAYRDRRNRKRDFRRLWITRINAAARREGMTYSDSSCTACTLAEVDLDRKVLADIAVQRPRDLPTFRRARPRGGGRLTEAEAASDSRGASRGALSRFRAHDHLPPQRAAQDHPPARPASASGRGPGCSWPRARTSSPPPRRPAWSAEALLVAGEDVEPGLLAEVELARLRDARRRRLPAAAGRSTRAALLSVYLHAVRRSRATSARSSARRTRSATDR